MATKDLMRVSVDGAEQAKAQLSGLQKQMIAVTAAAAAAITTMAIASVKAAAESESAVNRLDAALKNTGIYTESYSEQLRGLSTELMRLTKYDDDAISSATALMQNVGKLSANVLPAAQKAAIGLAAAFKMDLETAFQLVGKAAAGNFMLLSRYGIVIDQNLSQTEKFAKVLEIGARNFSLAEAETKTFAGSMAQLKNIWGEFLEDIGYTIIPILTKLSKSMMGLIDSVRKISPATKITAVAVTALGVALVALDKIQTAYFMKQGLQLTFMRALTAGFAAVKVAAASFMAFMTSAAGVYTLAAVAVVSLVAGLTQAKEEYESILTVSKESTTETSKQAAKFNILAKTYQDLAAKTNRTAAETNLLKVAINTLQSEYPDYLRNLDLEKGKYEDIKTAIDNTRIALQNKANQSIYSSIIEKASEYLAVAQKIRAYLTAGDAERQALFQFGFDEQDAIALRQIIQQAGGNRQRALQILDNLESYGQQQYNRILRSLPALQLTPPVTEAGGEGGGGALAAETPQQKAIRESAQKINALVIELRGYNRAFEEESMSAYDILDRRLAEYQAVLASVPANTEGVFEAQIAIHAWHANEINRLARLTLENSAEMDKQQLQAVTDYYDTVKTADSGYYDFKVAQIQREVSALSYLSEAQKAVLLNMKMQQLEQDMALEATTAATEQATKSYSELYDTIQSTLVDGISSAFSSMLTSGQSFSDAMTAMFKNMVNQMLAELAKLAVLELFKSIFSIGTGGVGGVVGTLTGSLGSLSTGNSPRYTPDVSTSQNDGQFNRLITRLENTINQRQPQEVVLRIGNREFRNAIQYSTIEANVM